MIANFLLNPSTVDKIIENYIREKHDFDKERFTVEIKRNEFDNDKIICVEVRAR